MKEKPARAPGMMPLKRQDLGRETGGLVINSKQTLFTDSSGYVGGDKKIPYSNPLHPTPCVLPPLLLPTSEPVLCAASLPVRFQALPANSLSPSQQACHGMLVLQEPIALITPMGLGTLPAFPEIFSCCPSLQYSGVSQETMANVLVSQDLSFPSAPPEALEDMGGWFIYLSSFLLPPHLLLWPLCLLAFAFLPALLHCWLWQDSPQKGRGKGRVMEPQAHLLP